MTQETSTLIPHVSKACWAIFDIPQGFRISPLGSGRSTYSYTSGTQERIDIPIEGISGISGIGQEDREHKWIPYAKSAFVPSSVMQMQAPDCFSFSTSPILKQPKCQFAGNQTSGSADYPFPRSNLFRCTNTTGRPPSVNCNASAIVSNSTTTNADVTKFSTQWNMLHSSNDSFHLVDATNVDHGKMDSVVGIIGTLCGINFAAEWY